MKRDTIFYELFQEFPNIFFELIGEANTDPQIYDFKSQEIKQRGFRLDGIFIPPNRNRNQPTYFVEAQCYKDQKFYKRFLTSIILYFNQYPPYNPDWYAIVVFDTRKNDVPFPEYLNALRQAHLKCFYLNEMGEDAYESLSLGILKLIVEGKRKAKLAAKQLVNKARQEFNNKAAQEKFLELIESIVINKYPSLSREEVQEMLTLNLIRGTRYYQELEEEITAKVEEKVKAEVKEEVKAEVKEEVKAEVKEEVKAEVEEEITAKVEEKVKAEVKLDTAARLLQVGINLEQVAAILELDVEVVRSIVNPLS
jgi:predicted transposase/invertase (TIGR01784 family)